MCAFECVGATSVSECVCVVFVYECVCLCMCACECLCLCASEYIGPINRLLGNGSMPREVGHRG